MSSVVSFPWAPAHSSSSILIVHSSVPRESSRERQVDPTRLLSANSDAEPDFFPDNLHPNLPGTWWLPWRSTHASWIQGRCALESLSNLVPAEVSSPLCKSLSCSETVPFDLSLEPLRGINEGSSHGTRLSQPHHHHRVITGTREPA